MPADGGRPLAPAPGNAWGQRPYDGGPQPATTPHSHYENTLGGGSKHPRGQVNTEKPDYEPEKSQLLGQAAAHDRQEPRGNAPEDTGGVSVLETWSIEIASSILALGCIAAVVILLSLHQGKPLPAWPKLISVNTLIAVFTAIFKASLIMPVAEGIGQLKWTWFDRPQRLSDIALYDGASRGPWGSLSLIVKQIPRTDKGYLAGLGAFITIAALAIDPFSQAMIDHRTCRGTAASGAASVPRANNYTANRNSEISSLHWAGDAGVSLPTVGALYKGMVDPRETASLLNVTCSTGNCDFGGDSEAFYFSSLAACQSCEDVTNETEEFKGPSLSFNESADDYFRSWRLPSNTRLYQVSANRSGNVLQSSSVIDPANETFPIDHFALYRIDVLAVTNPECRDRKDCSVESPAVRPLAVRCRFDACVKRYRGQVVNGTYAETEESDGLRLKYTGPRRMAAFALLTDTVTMNGRERRCEPTDDWADDSVRLGFDDKGGLSKVYESGVFSITQPLRWRSYPRECLWVLDLWTWWGLQSLFTSFFTDWIMHSGGSTADMAQVRGSPWLRRMYAGGTASVSTVEDVVAGLTAALTADIRNSPYGENERLARDVPERYRAAAGRAIATETCIYVEWGWLAYPAALMVLQWVFLVLVLGGRRKARGRGGWKSSPLALLFHSLDDDLRAKSGGGGLGTAGRMASAADGIRVQLVPTGGASKPGGWRFSET
ncbi:hypothetical protein CMUS01_09138 [Colletotrichum musicola]|uniref:Uncharacterized protein n=1 Tax=Colletotrichum musicola TaxID=2175873 RepID=A0A8H6NBU4_9PEZI|nr:hypothetical protein CMUS01_09138 [Colletotrichum musicola]